MEQYCLKDLQDSTSTAGQSGLKMSAHCGGKKMKKGCESTLLEAR